MPFIGRAVKRKRWPRPTNLLECSLVVVRTLPRSDRQNYRRELRVTILRRTLRHSSSYKSKDDVLHSSDLATTCPGRQKKESIQYSLTCSWSVLEKKYSTSVPTCSRHIKV